MRKYNFETQSSTSDWHLPFTLDASKVLPNGVWDHDDDVVYIGLHEDGAMWDDYGIMRRDARPTWSAQSNDGTNTVQLIDPNSVAIVVPAHAFSRMRCGTLDVGVRYLRTSTGATSTLLLGRLPIIPGII